MSRLSRTEPGFFHHTCQQGRRVIALFARKCGERNLVRYGALRAVAVGSLALGGCLTPPRARVALPSGEVRAASEPLAREVAEYAARAEREIRDRVPGLRAGGADIWVQEKVSAGVWSAVHMRTGEYAAFTLTSKEMAQPRIHALIAADLASTMESLGLLDRLVVK